MLNIKKKNIPNTDRTLKNGGSKNTISVYMKLRPAKNILADTCAFYLDMGVKYKTIKVNNLSTTCTEIPPFTAFLALTEQTD